jgi:hypothetical protein
VRLIVPYTRLDEDVRAALDTNASDTNAPLDYRPSWYYVGSSDRAYFDLLARLWDRGESFVIVEHDIIPPDGGLVELAGCAHDWCAFGYPYAEFGQHYGLGCVKFSGDLIARNPDALKRVGVMRDGNHPPRHWCRLDAWLQDVVLPLNGETMHQHERLATHLGAGYAHGCVRHPCGPSQSGQSGQRGQRGQRRFEE